MRRDSARFRAGAWSAALLLLCAAAAGAQEEELPAEKAADASAVAAAQSACGNEIGLFCRGESGASLLDCLSAYRGSATARCRAALAVSDPAAPSVREWGSQIAVQTGASSAPKSYGPGPALSAGPGFDFAVVEHTKTYALRGARPKEIVDQLGASGLKDGPDGGAGAAQTSAAVSFNYTTASRDGSCGVSSAHVRLTVVQTYPKRSDDGAALDGGWRRAEATMRVHADGHKQVSVRVAQEFLRRLQTLNGAPNCADLDGAVQALYRREQQDARRENAAYDAATNHGQKQWEQAAGAGERGAP
jgi:predicted secreted Zn-dependent protease